MTAVDFFSITCELARLLKGSKFEGHVFAVMFLKGYSMMNGIASFNIAGIALL